MFYDMPGTESVSLISTLLYRVEQGLNFIKGGITKKIRKPNFSDLLLFMLGRFLLEYNHCKENKANVKEIRGLIGEDVNKEEQPF